jgi:hypothetical protein
MTKKRLHDQKNTYIEKTTNFARYGTIFLCRRSVCLRQKIMKINSYIK